MPALHTPSPLGDLQPAMTIRSFSPSRLLLAGLLLLTLLPGCAALQPERSAAAVQLDEHIRTLDVSSPGDATRADAVTLVEGRTQRGETEIIRGTGRMIGDPRDITRLESGEITLHFENAELRDVIEAIFSEILDESYLIIGDISGRITLQTSRPLQRSAILPMFERTLQMAGRAIVHDPREDLYRIMSLEAASRAGHVIGAPRNVDAIRPGYQIAVVPLRYIAANEMAKILEPILPPGATLRVDVPRNLLILSATSNDIAIAMDNIDLFDIDLLEGLSVGMFPLENINPEVLSDELAVLFAADSDGPLAGMFRFIPMARLGSVLVVTPQAEYLDRARDWIRRLDRAQGDARGRNLYVYRLQNTNAEDIAGSLNQLYDFSVQQTGTTARRSAERQGVQAMQLGESLAPGQTGVTLGEGRGTTPADRSPTSRANPASNAGGDSDDGQSVRVVADTINNALLILARPAQYEDLRNAIQALDLEPLQVLVDATIVEVTLSDEFRFGLQWFFRDSLSGGRRGEGILSSGTSAELGRLFPGFNYSVIDSAGTIRGVLQALAQDERVEVLSSPSLMVLDNRSAQLRVGDQVPIRTSEFTSVASDGERVVSTIQFRDTGVLLTVTPRVNAGGLVTLDVVQEVSDVSRTTSSDIDSPTISNREIRSTVAVRSGETIVLGGLIRENRLDADTGVPFLKDIPVLGRAFASTERSLRRTELIVLLTPRVARDQQSARAITNEFRNRLDRLHEGLERWQP